MKKALKTIFGNKGSRIWFIVTASVLAFLLIVSLVLTQIVFLNNTINTVLGGARKVLVSGDPSKYQYYTVDNDDLSIINLSLTTKAKTTKNLKKRYLRKQISLTKLSQKKVSFY